MPVYSYQLSWSFCIENDTLFAKTDAEMKTKLFDMTVEDKKKRGPKPKDKTGKKPFKHWEDHPGGNKDDDNGNGDDDIDIGLDGTGADGSSGAGVAVATETAGDDDGFINDDDTRTSHYFTVLKVQQILRDYRSAAASVSGDVRSSSSSSSSSVSDPKAVEIGLDKCDDGFVGLRTLVQQVAMDPDLFTALAESDNNDLLDDLSEVLAAVENSGGDDADEACDNFDVWRASDNVEIHGEEFDKREREVIASAEATCRL